MDYSKIITIEPGKRSGKLQLLPELERKINFAKAAFSARVKVVCLSIADLRYRRVSQQSQAW